MNEACNVTTALSAFSSISLEEMSTIRLMNRTDTKYIVSLSALMDVLQRASNCYRVQEVQGGAKYSLSHYLSRHSRLRHVSGSSKRKSDP